jgi:hypothetical protein
MLRHVRDKLYQDGAGLPPQGRTVRCPSLSPPARGTAPLWSVSLRATSRHAYLLGDDPQTPGAGCARKTGAWFLRTGYVFWVVSGWWVPAGSGGLMIIFYKGGLGVIGWARKVDL